MSSEGFLGKLLAGAAVEWRPLGELAEIYGGLTGKNKSDFNGGNARFIPYKNIFANMKVDFEALEPVKVADFENQREIKYGDVLFTGSSEIAHEAGMSSSVTRHFEGSVYLNSFSFGVRFNKNVPIDPEFSKYLFRSEFMRSQIAKTASGVTRFNISKERFRKLQIPILCPEDPIRSLKIQAEIARILDAFTELTAELTTELKGRKKQYSHYRDQLLSFDSGEVDWKAMGDLVDINTGSKPSEILEKETNFDYINAGTSRSGFSAASNCAGDTVTTPSRGQGGIGHVGYQRKPFWLGPLCYKLQSVDTAVLINRYLFYFLQSRSELLLGLKKEGGVPAVNKSDLIHLEIPVPSREEQERIVAILDRFDALTHSITEGLPREIELRHKQHTYYLDLLTSFPKPVTEEA